MFGSLFEKRSADDTTTWTGLFNSGNEDLIDSTNDYTYNKSLNVLSDTVAKLPLLVKKTEKSGTIEAENFYLYNLLKTRPNTNMTAFETMKALIMMYKHYGQAGLYIDRSTKGKVKALYPVRIDSITVDNAGLIDSKKNNKILIDFTCYMTQGQCFDKDIIIIRDNSRNGITGESTKNYIKDIITSNLYAQQYQKDLFSNGLTNKAVIQMTSDVKDEKSLRKIQEKFNRLYSKGNRLFTVPAGFNITPLNLSLADSQFSELKIIGKKDIAAAVGVPYSIIDTGSLSEVDNISYLSNVIQPILTQIEQEMDYKLLSIGEQKQGYKIRFNVSAMLRTDAKTQMEILTNYIRNGVYTTNDVRSILGVKNIEGGDVLTMPSGQVLLEDLVNHNTTWSKTGPQKQKEPPKGGDDDE